MSIVHHSGIKRRYLHLHSHFPHCGCPVVSFGSEECKSLIIKILVQLSPAGSVFLSTVLQSPPQIPNAKVHPRAI